MTSPTQERRAPGEEAGGTSIRAAWLAWSVCGLTLVMIACAVALADLHGYDPRRLTFLVAEATAALVGRVIASRRPRNPVGWLIAGHALYFSLGEFSRQYAIYGTPPRTRRAALSKGHGVSAVLGLVPGPRVDVPPVARLPERT